MAAQTHTDSQRSTDRSALALPVAEEYLTQYMKYRLDPPSMRGLQTFLDMAAETTAQAG